MLAPPLSKAEIIAALRVLTARSPRTRDELQALQSECVTLAGHFRRNTHTHNTPHAVWHFLSDPDIRFKDPAYAKAQLDAISETLDAWAAEPSLEIRVGRDACCAQDDQLGPLEATYSFAPNATLADLVRVVAASKFLQYSSSHTTLTGFIGQTAFVRVFSASHLPDRSPEFLTDGDAPLATAVAAGTVEFRFNASVPEAPSRNPSELNRGGALFAVKLAHTAVWALFAGCILLLPWFVWRGDLLTATILIGVVMLEVAILLANRFRCPLTGVAARYTSDRRDNFDIFLPLWLARYNKHIFGTLFVLGVVYTLVEWRKE